MKEKVVQNANSKGLIQDYLFTNNKNKNYGMFGYSPRFDPQKALSVIRNDPVVRATIITIVDKVLESGWRLDKDHDKSGINSKKKKLEETYFDRYTRKILFHGILYNNAFGEPIITSDGLTDLNVVEPEHMKIDADDNGDINGYYQEIGNQDTNPKWKKDELVHYKFDDFTTNVWAEFNIQALYETVLIKDYIRQWLQWFFGTNQLRPILRFEANTASSVVGEILSYLKAAEKSLDKPLPIAGGMEVDRLQEFDKTGATVLQVLKWCDEQILVLMQVPAIAVGVADQSGRSNSVEQYQALNTRILSLQRQYEDYTNYDLFPKINFDNVTFSFGILDESTRKKAFEIVQMMKDSQFKDEAIVEYMESQGIVFETKELFKSDEELAQLSNKDLGTGHEGIKGNANADAMSSRKRSGGGTQGGKNNQVQVKNSFDSRRYW